MKAWILFLIQWYPYEIIFLWKIRGQSFVFSSPLNEPKDHSSSSNPSKKNPNKNAKSLNYGNLFFFLPFSLLLLLFPLFFFINKTSHKLYVTTLIKDPRALTVFIDRKKKRFNFCCCASLVQISSLLVVSILRISKTLLIIIYIFISGH